MSRNGRVGGVVVGGLGGAVGAVACGLLGASLAGWAHVPPGGRAGLHGDVGGLVAVMEGFAVGGLAGLVVGALAGYLVGAWLLRPRRPSHDVEMDEWRDER